MAEELPLKVASEGRLQLIVPASGQPIGEVQVSRGTSGRGSWLEDAGERERLVDVSFAVDWWRWRDLEIAFMPNSDGSIELHLSGPWAEEAPGVIFRQEILWDGLEAQGTEILNGDFASMDGWESPWRSALTADQWPIEGRELAASWHGRPLVQQLKVKAGREVRITLKARAAVVPGYVEPVKLKGKTAAHRANSLMKRGVNLGNCWEAPPGSWGIRYDVSDIDRIAAAGFDHVRVPVAWHFHMEGGKISPAFLKELEPVLRRALEKKMIVMLNWHHFDDLTSDPDGKLGAFVGGWRAVAAHFADWPSGLYFELLNEPKGELGGSKLNEVHAATIGAIRAISAERIIVVNPGRWATTNALGELHLPDGDDRIIVSVHCYAPFEFTHQGAEWVDLEHVKGVEFPGNLPLLYEQELDDAVAWSKHFGRPVHLGEFGAYSTADIESRRRYARALRKAAEARGIPWCWWEWKAGFGCWDGEKNEPILIRELMGE
ncbi:glycoside hydrolase family 5 protein [Haloferula sp.]|uniref:glycoside hydrolase family 5 protein n=1 Tax=Haloferula sp. TaxID=2497595 RepID=UPI003C7776EC